MNAIKYFSGFLLLIAALALQGCDKEEDCVYVDKRKCDPDFVAPADAAIISFTPDLSDYNVKVLLEDYTGFRCANCPDATDVANNLKNSYGEQIVLLAVHCMPQFAQPDPVNGFINDFRTTEGETWYPFFNLLSLPNGMVNRSSYNNSRVLLHTSWEDAVNAYIQNNPSPKAYIEFLETTFNSDSTLLTVNVAIQSLIPVEENYNFTLCVTESGILDSQKNGTQTIENYEHNHVLRGSVNGTWGQEAFSPALELLPTEALLFTYEIEIKPDWVPGNLSLVGFISAEESKEVIQAEEISFH